MNQRLDQERNDSLSIRLQQYVREEQADLNHLHRMDLSAHPQKPLEHLGNSWEA